MTLSKNVQGQFMNSLNNLRQVNIHLVGNKLKLPGGALVMLRKWDHWEWILQQSPPIPEASEHHSQLGDMKLSCPCRVWSVEDIETLEMKFNIEEKH